MHIKAGHSGRHVLALWIGCATLAVAVALPGAAQAQNVCNGAIDINYISGPPYGLVGDIYRFEVGLGAGSITGGALNQLTINRFRFHLDCSNFAFIGCTDEGDIIRYVADATITSSNCLDAGALPVTWSSNGVDSPVGPNQVIFTPSSPVVIPASTQPANGCKVAFDIRVQTAPGLDASPTIVQEAAGYNPTGPPFDAVCDNGVNASTSQSGQIFLCPACDDGECFDQACNQITGNCDQTNEPFSTQCTDTDGKVCTTAGCDGVGNCDQGHISTPASTTCPDTDGDLCTTAGCDGAGNCDQNHITVPCVGDCLTGACDPGTGNCIPEQASTQCTDTDGNVCTTAGCDGAGNCDQGHISAPASDPCPDTDNNECTTAGCTGAGACDQKHILQPVGTICEIDGTCNEFGECEHPPPPNDHYKCYRTLQTDGKFAKRDVDLEDQFATTVASVLTPRRFCNPVNKNGEGINDPTAHMMCYRITEPRLQRRQVVVENQFGVQTLTVLRAYDLCVPAEKDGVPSDLNLNHYKCYKVAQGAPKFTEREVGLVDQFETKATMVMRPRLLCNPVDKNGEGIVDGANHLTCYIIKDVAGQPEFEQQQVDVMDQFGEQDLNTLRGECRKTSFLCVPSTKRIPSPSGAFLDATSGALD